MVRLQSQDEQHGQRIQQAEDAVAAEYTGRLAAAASELSSSQLAAQEKRSQLLDANARLQQAQGCLAARISELETSLDDASSQVADLQRSVIALLQAWAALMQALGIHWEQPTEADLPHFMMRLQTAQQAALCCFSQMLSRDPAEQQVSLRKSCANSESFQCYKSWKHTCMGPASCCNACLASDDGDWLVKHAPEICNRSTASEQAVCSCQTCIKRYIRR